MLLVLLALFLAHRVHRHSPAAPAAPPPKAAGEAKAPTATAASAAGTAVTPEAVAAGVNGAGGTGEITIPSDIPGLSGSGLGLTILKDPTATQRQMLERLDLAQARRGLAIARNESTCMAPPLGIELLGTRAKVELLRSEYELQLTRKLGTDGIGRQLNGVLDLQTWRAKHLDLEVAMQEQAATWAEQGMERSIGDLLREAEQQKKKWEERLRRVSAASTAAQAEALMEQDLKEVRIELERLYAVVAGRAATPPEPPGSVSNAETNGGDSSALTMVEDWEIASGGMPFSSRPGARFPQEVFNWRAQEELKWLRARSTLRTESLKAMEAKASRDQTEYANYARLELEVIKAFGAELTDEEHLALAKAEAARPQSFFDDRLREAYQWMQQQQTLGLEERLRSQKAALAKTATELRAEIRRRYQRGVR